MATPYQMHIVPENTGLWKVSQTAAAAKKASELLQQDLKDHHVFFNTDGFHNHIPHHILALYGTGADAEALQKGYDFNASYQRQTLPQHQDAAPEELRDWDHAKRFLGKERYYPDFLAFFQREMERLPGGWQDVLNEYVFKPNDERATDMLVRLLSGFVHPLIQLMYGVEWQQPAIVAEALAQACVHEDKIRGFLLEAEALAQKQYSEGSKMPSIASLYEEAAADDKIANSVRNEDGNKLTQGALVRARDEMIKLAAKVKIAPGELDERTAEMFNEALFVAASAAANPKKHVKFDFFLIHHVNVCPIFLAINAAPWISTDAKVRLLEWKIRMDLAQYAARAVPPMSIDRIAAYKPKNAPGTDEKPSDVVSRLHRFDEDGHAIKLGRAMLICQQVSDRYADRDWMRLKGAENWTKVFHMLVDSVEGPGQHWVRTTGLDEAWKDIEDAPKL